MRKLRGIALVEILLILQKRSFVLLVLEMGRNIEVLLRYRHLLRILKQEWPLMTRLKLIVERWRGSWATGI
jgi:hypothetical protein